MVRTSPPVISQASRAAIERHDGQTLAKRVDSAVDRVGTGITRIVQGGTLSGRRSFAQTDGIRGTDALRHATSEGAPMPVHVIHATISVAFLVVWAMIGEILIRDR